MVSRCFATSFSRSIRSPPYLSNQRRNSAFSVVPTVFRARPGLLDYCCLGAECDSFQHDLSIHSIRRTAICGRARMEDSI